MRIPQLSSVGDKARITTSRLESANIGYRFWSASWAAIQDTAPYKDSLLIYVRDLHGRVVETGASLFLYGDHGAGKTAAGSLVLKEAMARGPVQAYSTLASYIDIYALNRDLTSPEGIPMWEFVSRRAHFLMVDELGAFQGSDWTARWIETLVSERYNRKLPTIITSNKTPEQCGKEVPRLRHLLGECYEVIHVTGADWRQ